MLVHSTNDSSNCEYCGKRFVNTTHLKSHIIYHPEALKFKSNFCGRMFKEEKRLIA